MKTKVKNLEKGITLIALIITIIVLLILAGVTLNIVLNNNLIGNSRVAVNAYADAQNNELETLEDIGKKLNGYMGSLDNINGKENKTITGGKPTYKNPIIPVGFKTSGDGASWVSTDGETVQGWNNGLVIEDEQKNQFVWVPVDGTNVKYEKWCTTGIAYNDNITDDELPTKVTSIWEEDEQSQITEYRGFYVARYEAGIPATLTEAIGAATVDARNIEGTPVSKKNQVPWNFIDYTHSKANAEKMYNNSDFVQSGLITGTQWDTIMRWFENGEAGCTTNSPSWGNYSDAAVTGITEYAPHNKRVVGANWTGTLSSRTKPTSGSNDDCRWLLKTGHSEYTNRNNIYDLAGNLWEWSNETKSSEPVLRGGDFGGLSDLYPVTIRVLNDNPLWFQLRLSSGALYKVAFKTEKILIN